LTASRKRSRKAKASTLSGSAYRHSTRTGQRESKRHRRPPLASLAPHQPRPARDAAHALERGGMVSSQSRVQESARAAERDPARGAGSIRLVTAPASCGAVLVRVPAFGWTPASHLHRGARVLRSVSTTTTFAGSDCSTRSFASRCGCTNRGLGFLHPSSLNRRDSASNRGTVNVRGDTNASSTAVERTSARAARTGRVPLLQRRPGRRSTNGRDRSGRRLI
jgi:hypothetical protein